MSAKNIDAAGVRDYTIFTELSIKICIGLQLHHQSRGEEDTLLAVIGRRFIRVNADGAAELEPKSV